jgi:hypothetical protein
LLKNLELKGWWQFTANRKNSQAFQAIFINFAEPGRSPSWPLQTSAIVPPFCLFLMLQSCMSFEDQKKFKTKK